MLDAMKRRAAGRPEKGAPMSARVNVVRLALVLLLCLAVPACKSKVTKANFDKIKEGMTLAEVEKILGKGTKEGGDGRVTGKKSSGF